MSVRTELEKRIVLWAAAQNPQIPVALENVPFQKPSTGNYLEVMFLTSAVINPTVDASSERETGILQVNCCVRAGTGTKEGNDLTENIKALFPVLPKTGTVSIEHPPNISQGLPRTDGFWVVPVSVSYRQER